MLDTLAEFDRILFHFINLQLANPITNWSMPVITSDTLLRVLYAVAVLLVLWKGNRQLRWTVIFSALTLVATDQLVSQVLKDVFERPRPCHALPEVHLLVNCGAGFSMPSAHAANAFGQALVWGVQVRRWLGWLVAFASVVSVSRVFVGVHYPLDVVVGSVVGALVGLGMSRLGAHLLEHLRRVPLRE